MVQADQLMKTPTKVLVRPSRSRPSFSSICECIFILNQQKCLCFATGCTSYIVVRMLDQHALNNLIMLAYVINDSHTNLRLSTHGQAKLELVLLSPSNGFHGRACYYFFCARYLLTSSSFHPPIVVAFRSPLFCLHECAWPPVSKPEEHHLIGLY